MVSEIRHEIQTIEGVWLLDVYSGWTTNRSVWTMIGYPSQVLKAVDFCYAFLARNANIFDHKGNHPRIGLVDVVPFVPVLNADFEALNPLIEEWVKHVVTAVDLPIFLYGNMGQNRLTNLYQLRKGGVRSLQQRLQTGILSPDYGPSKVHKTLGATIIGTRGFMAAYNLNLDTKDILKARSIAQEIRAYRDNLKVHNKYKLHSLRVLGWYIPEYKCCQISTNIYDLDSLTLDEVFELVSSIAAHHSVELKGSELVGMVPLKAFSKDRTVEEWVNTMGLNSVQPFNSADRILEFKLGNENPL